MGLGAWGVLCGRFCFAFVERTAWLRLYWEHFACVALVLRVDRYLYMRNCTALISEVGVGATSTSYDMHLAIRPILPCPVSFLFHSLLAPSWS